MRLHRRLCAFCVLGSVAALPARPAGADPPQFPLEAPAYSFDRLSPTVGGGQAIADGVLIQVDETTIEVQITSQDLGLGVAGDDLDALSAVSAPDLSDGYVLLFSVDAETTAVVPPDEELQQLGILYNATDQAQRGHQGGDQFMTTALFTAEGLDPAASPAVPNNVLVRNNFDEGGTDFVAQPPTSASDVVAQAVQDNVDATATVGSEYFFSVSAGSPSAVMLPNGGQPSGAHIYYYEVGMEQPQIYATFSDLGLQALDDIDAMVVLENQDNTVFDASDKVLFSLTADSPSLLTIPGASADGAAADIFVSSPAQGAALFTNALNLGLCGELDNVDALDILDCDDGFECDLLHGIQEEEDDETEQEEDDETEIDKHGRKRTTPQLLSTDD